MKGYLYLFLFILFSSLVVALPHVPQGDIWLVGLYGIRNGTNTSFSQYCNQDTSLCLTLENINTGINQSKWIDDGGHISPNSTFASTVNASTLTSNFQTNISSNIIQTGSITRGTWNGTAIIDLFLASLNATKLFALNLVGVSGFDNDAKYVNQTELTEANQSIKNLLDQYYYNDTEVYNKSETDLHILSNVSNANSTATNYTDSRITALNTSVQNDDAAANDSMRSYVDANFSTLGPHTIDTIWALNETVFQNNSDILTINTSWWESIFVRFIDGVFTSGDNVSDFINSNITDHENTFKHGNTTAEIQVVKVDNATNADTLGGLARESFSLGDHTLQYFLNFTGNSGEGAIDNNETLSIQGGNNITCTVSGNIVTCAINESFSIGAHAINTDANLTQDDILAFGFNKTKNFTAGFGLLRNDTDFNLTLIPGWGLIFNGETIELNDSSSQGSVDNSGTNVIQDVSLDGNGRVTLLVSTDLGAHTSLVDSFNQSLNTSSDVNFRTVNASVDLFVNGISVVLQSGTSGENITSGTVADARIASTLSRDSEAVAAGDISGSLSGGYTIDSSSVQDAEIDYTQVTLNDFTDDVGFIQNGTDVNFSIVNITGAFSVNLLVSCDTIDTDANGTFKCGTDQTGSGREGVFDVVNGVNINISNNLSINNLTSDGRLEAVAISVGGVDVVLQNGTSGENITLGTVADARIASTLSRDSEAVASGDISGNLGAGYTIDASSVQDDEMDYNSVTLKDFTDDIGFLKNGSDVNFSKVNITGAFSVHLLVSCDTIDTDANGTFKCGTDTGGTDTTLTEDQVRSNATGFVNSTSWNRTGTDVFFANTGDNVGIGTTPTNKLTVNGSTLINLKGSNNFVIQYDDLEVFKFDPNAFTLTAKEGITIHFNDSIFKIPIDNGFPLSDREGLIFLDDVKNKFYGNIDGTANGWKVLSEESNWNRTGTNLFQINLGDNVGIGTRTPDMEFNVNGSVNITGGLTIVTLSSCDTIDTDVNGSFKCGSDDGSSASDTTLTEDQVRINASGFVNSTSFNRAGTNVVLGNIGDNVGLGISLPTSKLHIVGAINITSDLRISNWTIREINGNLVFEKT